jgi:hypothetical protein
MSNAAMLIISKLGFYGAIGVVIYLIYYELTSSRIRSKEAEIKLKEKENENKVNSLTPSELIDLINKDNGPGGTKGGSS